MPPLLVSNGPSLARSSPPSALVRGAAVDNCGAAACPASKRLKRWPNPVLTCFEWPTVTSTPRGAAFGRQLGEAVLVSQSPKLPLNCQAGQSGNTSTYIVGMPYFVYGIIFLPGVSPKMRADIPLLGCAVRLCVQNSRRQNQSV
jgi:hypothetical protein